MPDELDAIVARCVEAGARRVGARAPNHAVDRRTVAWCLILRIWGRVLPLGLAVPDSVRKDLKRPSLATVEEE